ncbi:helix-turn-helix transcriptional regulator [Polaribacter cellanae]|uniref:Response regulator transcription factor n=1 Tax=Polaribacter cellanae TaxID=2818493 RepID=A0A975H7T1_9FLAO|nr:LuxR C-terminal-related transcriptional regulator [Polaribacter cellanae]QTE23294.1 response regulator transcription factor [Polaribacter cellanae]
MPDVDDFFSFINRVDDVSEEDQKQAVNYLESIDAFARTTYKSLYVIDYEKKGFDYVSENPLFLCGNTSEEVKKMGYAFYFKHVVKEDLELLLKINTIGFEYYERVPLGERKDYTISYDFHLVNKLGEKTLINHKMTPLFMTSEGKLWKAIAIISLSSETKSGNIKVTNRKNNKVIIYNLESNFWKETEAIKLTNREKEILKHSTRGYTVNQIAEAIFVSPDTVKFHRKKLFEKLGVANISEAITYATNNKLI